MSAELIKSLTRRDTLVLDGYMYVHNVVKEERIYWECVEKRQYQCFGRAVSMGNRTYCSRQHTHPPDPAKVEMRKAEEMCCDQALSTNSSANAIITSVGKMLPITRNPYLTTSGLLKTIRRVRKRAIMRVNAANKKKAEEAAGQGGSVSNAGCVQLVTQSSTQPGFVRLPSTAEEDVKPRAFLSPLTEMPSVTARGLIASPSVEKSPTGNAHKPNADQSNLAIQVSTAPRIAACTSTTSHDDANDELTSTGEGGDAVVTGEPKSIQHSGTGHTAASTDTSPLPYGVNCASFRNARRSEPEHSSDSRLSRRSLNTSLPGCSMNNPRDYLCASQPFRTTSSSVVSYPNITANAVRLDSVMDAAQRRAQLTRRGGTRDFGAPLHPSPTMTGEVLSSSSPQAKRRRSSVGTPPTEAFSQFAPFQPCLGNTPIARNVKYLDSGLTISLSSSPDLTDVCVGGSASGADISNERFVVFTTDKCLRLLSWHEWSVDVDTQALADCFAFGCLITVCARVEGRNIRCAWLLLSSKGAALITRALQALKSTKNDNLNPKLICVDYDRQLLLALEKTFPNAQLCGSFEHLRRRFIDQVNSLSLPRLCPSYRSVLPKLKMILALAFIPPVWVLNAFQELDDKLCLAPEAQPVQSYFEDTFIGRPFSRGGRRLPLFKVNLWNVHTLITRSPHYPFQVWPERGWGRGRCASCRLTLSELETNIKEECSASAREYENLMAGNLKCDALYDQLQASNQRISAILSNFRNADIITLLTELAAEIRL